METQIVEVRKNIHISVDMNHTRTFTANINIDFIPDEMIVKHILFTINNPTVPDNFSSSIYTNIVSDFIGSFSDLSSGNSVAPNIIFTLKKPINGVYNFAFFSSANINQKISVERTGDLDIHLEFIKYKTTKLDKIY